MSVRDPTEISSRAFVGYPVQADLFLICYYCILLYVGSLSNKNQSIDQSIIHRLFEGLNPQFESSMQPGTLNKKFRLSIICHTVRYNQGGIIYTLQLIG